jgi:dTDP-4-amino-4,6-dideoxygalactose transaminase
MMNPETNRAPQAPVYVTQPSLPPLEEYVELLREIWDRKWLTNRGHCHKQFEKELAAYLGVEYVSLFCNGMIALQVGLQALRLTGEVITTPYSFPATTHALWWNHCSPVFCDVDPQTCNLDPSKIESLVTPRTTAIMPVHVYGRPCDVEEIQRIADIYGLKVFYDAAHAFGVKQGGQSVLRFGDLSMLSFHATKVFNTAEGGALVTNDPKMKARIDYLKNFGFADETTVVAPGTNGKMNELQSALGLVQLKHVGESMRRRLAIDALYRERLGSVKGLRIPGWREDVVRNGAYFPVFVEDEFGRSRDELYGHLKERGFLSRRYFYPLISEFPMYRHLPSADVARLPNAKRLSEQVLCLPIFEDLEPATANAICDEIDHCRASAEKEG